MKFSTDYKPKFTKQVQSGFTKIIIDAHDLNGATLAKPKLKKSNKIVYYKYFTRSFISEPF